jgi:dCTP diphosphatase
MSDINELTDKIVNFRDDRDWKQFHNPKDLAMSLLLEAAEVLEHFQWKSPEEMAEHINNNKGDIAEELADTLYWILLMSRDLDIDIKQALELKLKKNEEKYPIEKAKGNHLKYTRL